MKCASKLGSGGTLVESFIAHGNCALAKRGPRERPAGRQYVGCSAETESRLNMRNCEVVARKTNPPSVYAAGRAGGAEKYHPTAMSASKSQTNRFTSCSDIAMAG